MMDWQELKIKRLNGWLRFSVWTILFLVAAGTIAGILYWRRWQRADEAVTEGRKTAVGLIVRAQQVSDSLARARHEEQRGWHEEEMEQLDALHPGRENRREWKPTEPLDTAKLYEQLQWEKK